MIHAIGLRLKLILSIRFRAMIHYNVWFRFQPNVDETEGLAIIHAFLVELHLADGVAGFQLLKNTGDVAKTKMLPFQALIEFRDGSQFSAAFAAQAARGIHTGLHGRVMSLVSDFQIEVFKQLAASSSASATEPAFNNACEV